MLPVPNNYYYYYLGAIYLRMSLSLHLGFCCSRLGSLLSFCFMSCLLSFSFVFLTDPSSHPRQRPSATDLCYKTEISSLMDFNSPDASLDKGKSQTALLTHSWLPQRVLLQRGGWNIYSTYMH